MLPCSILFGKGVGILAARTGDASANRARFTQTRDFLGQITLERVHVPLATVIVHRRSICVSVENHVQRLLSYTIEIN